jgi:hypothetical protein
MRWRASIRNPASQSVRFRAIWLIHLRLGRGRIPAISTLRVLRSMTRRTKYRIKPERVMTSPLKKSVAEILGNDVSSPTLSLQKGLPGHPLFPARVESIFDKEPLDRVSCDLTPEIVERSSDSGVAPTQVVAGHPEDQLLDVCFRPRTTWSSILAAVIFLRDQLSIPTKQSVRCHQSPDRESPFSTDLFGLDRESAALSIGESRSLSAELFAQHAVFLLEEFNPLLLVPIDPASKDQHQKMERESVHRPEFRPARHGESGRDRRSGTRLSA